jgi:hypothetical protein
VSNWTLRLHSGRPAYFQLDVGPKSTFLANRELLEGGSCSHSDKLCHFAEPTVRCLGPDRLGPEE